jgi:predicted restriction endonuclease
MLIQVICKNCQKTFNKRETEVKKSPNHYCSKSCAAKSNNKSPKRKKMNTICKKCNQLFTRNRRKYCDNCVNAIQPLKLSDYTTKGSNKFSSIRKLARKKYIKNKKELKCFFCNYNKHVEISHIKAIISFESDTLISDINDLNNLIALCPNCHWEFDNGLLVI